MSNVECYLCKSDRHHQRTGTVRGAPELKVLECDNCGLVFLSSFEHIQPQHYSDSGMHGDALPAIEDWIRESEADDERRYRSLLPALTGKRVLDFGCGAGGFLIKAQPLAEKVVGIEPELRLQTHFAQAGLEVLPTIEAIRASGQKFDLITAFHVVEHLPDPRTTIVQLAELLAEGGSLIVEVPNSEDALLTLYKCDPFAHFTYWSQHLFLFNPHTLAELIKQVDLNLVWVKQIQRYPLSNHLRWLAQGKPGGHKQWAFMDTPLLTEAYGAQLAALGRCDTIMAGIQK